MKNLTSTILLPFILALTVSSCSISKFTAPPFTDVNKILTLEPGKTLDQVNDILKIPPYDVVYAHDSGKKILVYNYRVRDRRMPVRTNSAGIETHNEESQRKGEPWYNDFYRELFLVFESDTLTNVYGEDALSVAGYFNALDQRLDGVAVNPNQTEDYLLVQGVYQERQFQKRAAALEEDKKVKRRNKILLYAAGLLGLSLINIF